MTHSHELALGMGLDLIVKASQDPSGRSRVVVLDEVDIEAGGRMKCAPIPRLHEEAAIVSVHPRCDEHDPRQI